MLLKREMQAQTSKIAAWLGEHLPRDVAARIDIIGSSLPFHAIEEAVVRTSVQKRRNEFHTGRRLAREALRTIKCAPLAIPVGDKRQPVWPSGYVGTITHTDDLCLVVVGSSNDYLGLGVDLERAVRLEKTLLPSIAKPEELASIWVEADGSVDPGLLCFSAKETFYKAYFQATGVALDFSDATISVAWHDRKFSIALCPHFPLVAGRRNFEGTFANICGYAITFLSLEKAI